MRGQITKTPRGKRAIDCLLFAGQAHMQPLAVWLPAQGFSLALQIREFFFRFWRPGSLRAGGYYRMISVY